MIRTTSIAATLLVAVGMAGCDSSSSNNNNGNMAPAPVTLTQVDQMGRSGVNTAVTDPFFRASEAAEQARHDMLTDQYNSTVSATGSADFSSRFADNLAIYDGADGMCGNQLLADDMNVNGRYTTLASVLADDQVYVDSRNGVCDQYFGVELNAVGVPGLAGDCGGRTITYDTIDVTYSAVTIGAASGVTDGVPEDADDPRNELAKEGTFPFLGAPLSMVP